MSTSPEKALDSQHSIVEQVEDFPFLQKNNLISHIKDGQLKRLKWATLLVFLTAYAYSLALLEGNTYYYFPISISLLMLPEWLAMTDEKRLVAFRALGKGRLEAQIFLVLTFSQSLAIALWGLHAQMEFFQLLSLHVCYVFYILARWGRLNQGQLGIMVWFDSIQGFFSLPFSNMFLAIQAFMQPYKTYSSQRISLSKSKQHILFLLLSLLVSAGLVAFVWSQLSQVSANFASLTLDVGLVIHNFFDWVARKTDFSTLVFHSLVALVVGLYLYGLVGGAILQPKAKKDAFNYQLFQQFIRPLQVFPPLCVYIVMGSLCLTYALFFAAGLSEVGTLLSAGSVAPQDASTVAVAGFWQLVRVSLLNFAILGGFYIVAKYPLWDKKGTRLATTLLFFFAGLLALLASWKLFGIYIFLYGPTPLRLLSGWFVLVLLVWCLLTLIRLYKPIQAIRIGIFYALISFSLLCYLYPFLLS